MAQKQYKSKYDWVTEMIYRELCKKLTFEYADEWYIQKKRICPRK